MPDRQRQLSKTKKLRILVAPDKFKGTLTSEEAAQAMSEGIRNALPDTVEIEMRPLADGGEGSHSTLLGLDAGMREEQGIFSGLVGDKTPCTYLTDGENAYLETAHIIGLGLAGARDIPTLDRTTRGVGEWMLAATEAGASSLHLFLGGSATVDGGFGLAHALGFRFLGGGGNPIKTFRGLIGLDRIEFPSAPIPKCWIYTDVMSPLTGPAGSAKIFAPQKGAAAEEIAEIERRLEKMRSAFLNAGGADVNACRGSGAAGGLAAPILAHPHNSAGVLSGIEFFLEKAGIAAMCDDWKPDLIMTGEGCTDKSTLAGKVVMGVRQVALKYGVGFVVVSGAVRDRDDLRAAGLDMSVRSTVDLCGPVPEPLSSQLAWERLARTAGEAVRGLTG